MEVINKLLINSLNGFAISDIPLFLFQLFTAGFLAHLFQIIINKKWNKTLICNAALISVSITILASMVKYSLPFAVLALGVLIWFQPKKDEPIINKLALLIIGVIGVGCGIGSVFQTVLGLIVLLLIIILTPLKSNS